MELLKVTYTNGTSVVTKSEDQAMALYRNAYGRADVYMWSEYLEEWCLHADGFDYYGEW